MNNAWGVTEPVFSPYLGGEHPEIRCALIVKPISTNQLAFTARVARSSRSRIHVSE